MLARHKKRIVGPLENVQILITDQHLIATQIPSSPIDGESLLEPITNTTAFLITPDSAAYDNNVEFEQWIDMKHLNLREFMEYLIRIVNFNVSFRAATEKFGVRFAPAWGMREIGGRVTNYSSYIPTEERTLHLIGKRSAPFMNNDELQEILSIVNTTVDVCKQNPGVIIVDYNLNYQSISRWRLDPNGDLYDNEAAKKDNPFSPLNCDVFRTPMHDAHNDTGSVDAELIISTNVDDDEFLIALEDWTANNLPGVEICVDLYAPASAQMRVPTIEQ